MKKILLDRKVAYFHNQLLLENDFVDEQEYLLGSRYRDTLGLHGWGIAHGLEVTRTSEFMLRVEPGFAVDEKGHGIPLIEPQVLTLTPHERGVRLYVTLGYRTEARRLDERPGNRIDCSVALQLTPERETPDITLAAVDFHEKGVTVRGEGRRHLHPNPGSVVGESLAAPLRRGWINSAFRPFPLPHDEEDNIGQRPGFLVGATQATAGNKEDTDHKGATSAMGFALPFGVNAIHACRIAGAENLGEIEALFFKSSVLHIERGGQHVVEHVRKELCNIRVAASPHGYDLREQVPDGSISFNHPAPDDTLTVLVRATRYCRVSLIGVEVSY